MNKRQRKKRAKRMARMEEATRALLRIISRVAIAGTRIDTGGESFAQQILPPTPPGGYKQ